MCRSAGPQGRAAATSGLEETTSESCKHPAALRVNGPLTGQLRKRIQADSAAKGSFRLVVGGRPGTDALVTRLVKTPSLHVGFVDQGGSIAKEGRHHV